MHLRYLLGVLLLALPLLLCGVAVYVAIGYKVFLVFGLFALAMALSWMMVKGIQILMDYH